MQPVWIKIFSSRQFAGTFENTPWREGKTMQPVSIYIHRGRQFEDAFENREWKKADLEKPHGPVQKIIEPKEAKVYKFYQAHESKSI